GIVNAIIVAQEHPDGIGTAIVYLVVIEGAVDQVTIPIIGKSDNGTEPGPTPITGIDSLDDPALFVVFVPVYSKAVFEIGDGYGIHVESEDIFGIAGDLVVVVVEVFDIAFIAATVVRPHVSAQPAVVV